MFRYEFSIPQHGHPVHNGIQIAHPVGNIDDCHPIIPKPSYDVKQCINFRIRKGRSWFVHNKQLAVGGQRLGNLNHLLFRHTEGIHFA